MFSFSIVLYIIVLRILQFYYLNSTESDICDTAHGVILEQNPAYDCLPVHRKPAGNEYQEIRRGYPLSSAQGNVYA